MGRIVLMIKSRFIAPVLGLGLVVGVALVGQPPPKRYVAPGRHHYIAAAQRLSQQAFERIVDAQRANEWDMQGHAQKAKDLLEQVNNELRQAATAANKNSK